MKHIKHILYTLLFAASTIAGTALAEYGTRGFSISVKKSEAPDAPVVQEVELYKSSYALVIGNDAYNNGWPPLSNAVKDAKLIADALENKGFEVELHTDLNSSQLDTVFISRFPHLSICQRMPRIERRATFLLTSLGRKILLRRDHNLDSGLRKNEGEWDHCARLELSL